MYNLHNVGKSHKLSFLFPDLSSPPGCLLAALLVTEPGLSLRCYSCNSKEDISCWNLTSSSRDVMDKVSECNQEGMECMQKIGNVNIYNLSQYF